MDRSVNNHHWFGAITDNELPKAGWSSSALVVLVFSIQRASDEDWRCHGLIEANELQCVSTLLYVERGDEGVTTRTKRGGCNFTE